MIQAEAVSPTMPAQTAASLMRTYSGNALLKTTKTLSFDSVSIILRHSDLFDTAMLATMGHVDLKVMRTILVVRGASYPPPQPFECKADIASRVHPSLSQER